ncbi:MAG: nucleotidyltransferase domain-containing protein [Bacteroidetes bacterium]|nr:nucleotidyltransferase domain-containing protein [Bacteroidota bacterium]
MTNNIKTYLFKMENLGDTIRKLREEKELPLRTVAAYLDIDQAILSKMERGLRKMTREHVVKLAAYYKVKEEDLLVAWLSDKLVYEVADEEIALKALHVAEDKIQYKKLDKPDKGKIIQKIRTFFEKDGRADKVWIFGSFTRNDYNSNSDIDLMVRFKKVDKISLFDYADIAYLLESQLNIKIDLVEEGCISPFAWETAKNDLKLIYE